MGCQSEWDDAAAFAQLKVEDFSRWRMINSGFHPQGTAAMGRVVDKDLQLIGSERIAVCDASVLPASPGVNPMVGIMALSLRLADRIIAAEN